MAEKLKPSISGHRSATLLTQEQLVFENSWLRTQLLQAKTLIADHQQSFARLQQQSQLDFLTQMPTRLLLADRAVQAFRQADRQHTEVLVIFLDVDHFKKINDHFGHSTGDQVLVQVAQRLQQCLRGSDTVCRYGGDEFVLLLPLTYKSCDVAAVVSKLVNVTELPMTVGGQIIEAEVSIGVAIYPKHGADLATLVAKADQAMYEAKASGGHHYRISHAGA